MKEIGGYFELELPINVSRSMHPNAVKVNSGRHALEYILLALDSKVRRLWIPYYTCDVILQPIKRLGLNFTFYHINRDLEIDEYPNLSDGDYIVINNYFGIKDAYVKELAIKYKEKLIIDNAQAWYMKEIPGINIFYSPRKFFGLPDGGLACVTEEYSAELEPDKSYDRCSHLLKRIDLGASYGYADFKANSAVLNTQSLMRMSALSERILSTVDFEWSKIKRRDNFYILHNALQYSNMFSVPPMQSFACPMIYPYMTNEPSLRQHLIDNKIFVATYWPNVFEYCNKYSVECNFAKFLIPLPIDQRYGKEDMDRIIKIINEK